MKLKVYKSLWGMSGSLEKNVEQIAQSGYDGIESAIVEIADRKLFHNLLRSFDLEYIPLVYTEGTDHLADLQRLLDMTSSLSPKKIIVHAGRDIWSYSEQLKFFEQALRVEEEFAVPFAHETHRRRPFFSPMNTLALLREFPELKLNADLSHWCCVCESLLEDHEEAIALCTKRAIHIHSRVGYENGPQVSHPGAPEWSIHLAKFESWWKQIIEAHAQRGEPELTVTPEYGPPTYMQTVPFDNTPVTDLWQLCLWSAERFRELFNESISTF
ncbi:MAG: sugar phosphate isomerase/epimerase [Ignavibacteriota bacterium]